MIKLNQAAKSGALKALTTVAVANTTRTLQDVPSPSGALPLLGHYLQIRQRQGNLSELYKKYFDELGPIFKVQLPRGKNIVCFADPDAMESVYRSEGLCPVRTYTAPANFQWFYGKKNLPVPFVFLTGKTWRDVRSKHGKQATLENVHTYIPGFIQATQRLLRNIKEASNKDNYINDLHPLICNWSMEASAYFILGAELDLTQNEDTEETRRFQEGIRSLISSIDDFMIALPFFKIFPTKLVRNLNKATDDLYGIGQKYIDKYLTKMSNGFQESSTGQTFVEQLLHDGQMSEKEVIMSAIFMFGGSVDTTPNNTSFMLYELSKHREVQEKLRDQVVSVIGETGKADGQSLQRMPYLMNIIKETQRVNATSPHHVRTLPKDMEILGYTIPAQTTLFYSSYAVGNNEKYFKEPQTFDPDRWERDDIHPFSILPFGVGPRGCWGRRFAETEMKILLTEICRHYIMECDDPPTTRLTRHEKLFSRPGAPLKIRFIPRNTTV